VEDRIEKRHPRVLDLGLRQIVKIRSGIILVFIPPSLHLHHNMGRY